MGNAQVAVCIQSLVPVIIIIFLPQHMHTALLPDGRNTLNSRSEEWIEMGALIFHFFLTAEFTDNWVH